MAEDCLDFCIICKCHKDVHFNIFMCDASPWLDRRLSKLLDVNLTIYKGQNLVICEDCLVTFEKIEVLEILKGDFISKFRRKMRTTESNNSIVGYPLPASEVSNLGTDLIPLWRHRMQQANRTIAPQVPPPPPQMAVKKRAYKRRHELPAAVVDTTVVPDPLMAQPQVVMKRKRGRPRKNPLPPPPPSPPSPPPVDDSTEESDDPSKPYNLRRRRRCSDQKHLSLSTGQYNFETVGSRLRAILESRSIICDDMQPTAAEKSSIKINGGSVTKDSESAVLHPKLVSCDAPVNDKIGSDCVNELDLLSDDDAKLQNESAVNLLPSNNQSTDSSDVNTNIAMATTDITNNAVAITNKAADCKKAIDVSTVETGDASVTVPVNFHVKDDSTEQNDDDASKYHCTSVGGLRLKISKDSLSDEDPIRNTDDCTKNEVGTNNMENVLKKPDKNLLTSQTSAPTEKRKQSEETPSSFDKGEIVKAVEKPNESDSSSSGGVTNGKSSVEDNIAISFSVSDTKEASKVDSPSVAEDEIARLSGNRSAENRISVKHSHSDKGSVDVETTNSHKVKDAINGTVKSTSRDDLKGHHASVGKVDVVKEQDKECNNRGNHKGIRSDKDKLPSDQNVPPLLSSPTDYDVLSFLGLDSYTPPRASHSTSRMSVESQKLIVRSAKEHTTVEKDKAIFSNVHQLNKLLLPHEIKVEFSSDEESYDEVFSGTTEVVNSELNRTSSVQEDENSLENLQILNVNQKGPTMIYYSPKAKNTDPSRSLNDLVQEPIGMILFAEGLCRDRFEGMLLCGSCTQPVIFTEFASYEMHLNICHQRSILYKCSKCGARNKSAFSAESHLIQKHAAHTKVCKTGETSATDDRRKDSPKLPDSAISKTNHKRPLGPDQKNTASSQFPCGVCNLVFKSHKECFDHMDIHTNTKAPAAFSRTDRSERSKR